MNKIYSLATTFFLSLSLNSFAVTQGGGSKATAPQEVSGATRLKKFSLLDIELMVLETTPKGLKFLEFLKKQDIKQKLLAHSSPIHQQKMIE